MTLQQLRYITMVAEKGTISEAAKELFISQPSLTNAIRELEQEMQVTIFHRTNKGVTITAEGDEFLAYARQILDQVGLMQERYLNVNERNPRFSVSCQHYSFAVNAFVDVIRKFDARKYDFTLRETQTYEIIEDVAKLKSEIGHLKAAAERSKKWADTAEGRKIGIDPTKTEKSLDRRAVEGAKAKAMMKRMKAVESRRQTAIDEKSELLKNREYIDTLKIPSIKAKSATVLSVQNLVPYYCDNGDSNALCEPVSFTLSDGERLCLSGKNGCGKSTILKIIAGADISYSGSIAKAPGLKISVLPQDTNGLCGTLDEFSERLGVDSELVRAILAKLGFSRRELIGRTENLSAGQKKKVLIAGSLATPANLYIWDEPLNFVDIISRIQLERLLGANTPTMLLAEHDRYFCENTGTKRLYITKG